MPMPAKIHSDAIPFIPAEEAPTGVRIRRLISRARHGSELLLGVCVMAPGERSTRWSSVPPSEAREDERCYGPVEETYYCLKGHLTLEWDQGKIEFGPDDTVYLAPGWHYVLENTGREEAFFVYNMTPSPA